MIPDLVEEARYQALADYRGSVLDELRAGTVRWAIVSVAGGAALALLGALSVSNPIEPRLFLTLLGLFVVAGLAALAYRIQPRGGALVLVAGLLALFAISLADVPVAIVAPWAAVIVMIATIVLGWPAGLLALLAVASVLRFTIHPAADAPFDPSAANALLLGLAALLGATLTSFPHRRVLGWTWGNYLEALDRTREARERQAELARLSKSLSESYYRMEQLNLELERARRTAQEARRLKEQFAAAVSHELRTPLNLIIGFCEMMVLSPESAYGQRLPSSYRSDLEAIYRNSCHISSLIDDILDLSQIDAGRMALHREWTELPRIVNEAVATVETLFRDRDVLLQVALPRDLPPLFVDRTRIRQILINWLANAARFTEQGSVTIQANADTDRLIVSVHDTGPGIPPDEQALLFEEFHQVAGKRWQRGGSGLGLAVSRRFAELHGGATWVESELGRGSTFFLKLPLEAADEPGGERAETDWNDRVAARVRGQTRPRVLVLDDAGQVGRIFQRYLDGYEVITVDEFRATRGSAQELPIHAAVLGSEASRERWEALRDENRDLEGALLVSCPLHTSRRMAEDLGVRDYLVKPVSRDRLRAALEKLDSPVRSAVIVDDDPEMNRLLRAMLRSIVPGCAVWSAEDGQAAIGVLRDERPDLILLDLLMPLVDGYAVLQAARADPELRAVPVIVVTARGRRDEAAVTTHLSFSQAGGLTVAEVMQWLKTGLDARLQREPFVAQSS